MKLNRKWFMVIALVLSLTMATGGTLAYLIDTDTKINTFTVGNVDIELTEPSYPTTQPTLLPGVTIPKDPKITNKSTTSPAWVWMKITVPKDLMDYIDWNTTDWEMDKDESSDPVVVTMKRTTLLPANTETNPAFTRVALPANLTAMPTSLVGEDSVDIIVNAYAIQDQPFGNIDTAIAAFGNGDGTPGIKLVDNAEDLVNALKAGGNVYLSGNITLPDNTQLSVENNTVLNLDSHTLSVTNTENKASAAINNKANLTIKGGTLTYSSTQPSDNNSYSTNTITNYGNLVIDGATIINNTIGGSSNAIDNNPGSTLHIKSGKITSKEIAVRVNNGATATIDDGEIIGKTGVQIYLYREDASTETNLTINGGTFTANGQSQFALYSFALGDISAANTNVTITDGTFNGYVVFGAGNDVGDEKLNITGGDFTYGVWSLDGSNDWKQLEY